MPRPRIPSISPFGAGLAVVFAAVVASPLWASGLVAEASALAGGAAVLLWRLRSSSLPGRAALPLGLLAALTGWLAVAASRSAHPALSLLGISGQRTGVALWVTATVWFAAGVLSSTRADLGAVARVGALGGVALSAGALLDRLGMLPSAGRFSPEAAGFLDSSISLAQALLLCLACGAAWLATARSASGRVIAAASVVACGAGLALAQSRAALVGAIVALAFGALTTRARDLRRLAAVLPAAAAALVIAALVAGALAIGGTSATASSRAAAWRGATNGRSVLWRSAFMSAARSPLTGRGVEQYSAWSSWTSPEVGALESTGSYDPHDAWLYLLLGGGVIGVVLGLAFAASTARALLGALAGASMPRPAVALAGGLAAWGVAVLFGWFAPLATVLVAALGGMLLRSLVAHGAAERPGLSRAIGVVLAVTAVAVLAAGFRPGLAEWRYAADLQSGRPEDPARLEQAYSASGDPLYAISLADALTPGARAGDPDSVSRLERILLRTRPDAAWHVDTALVHVQSWQVLSPAVPDAWSSYRESVEAGRLADPASGLWDYAGAIEADRLGRKAEARSYARRALTYPQPPAARAWLATKAR